MSLHVILFDFNKVRKLVNNLKSQMFEYKIGKWNYNYSDYVKFESLIDNKLPFLTYIILLSVILDKPLNAPKFQILQTRYI